MSELICHLRKRGVCSGLLSVVALLPAGFQARRQLEVILMPAKDIARFNEPLIFKSVLRQSRSYRFREY
jgi:hypothetical protein